MDLFFSDTLINCAAYPVKTLRIVDLSHLVTCDMPVYPGTEPPAFTTVSSIGNDGFLERLISMSSHTGTHIDAPCHMVEGAKSLDQFEIGQFAGKAAVLNLLHLKRETIAVEDLVSFQKVISKSEFLLFQTGWSRFWGTEEYFSGYPVLSREAALWLEPFDLKGIGFDAISADRADSRDFPIHRILLGEERIIIENLNHLEELLQDRDFIFACFPLKIKQADGSPARAIAMIQ